MKRGSDIIIRRFYVCLLWQDEADVVWLTLHLDVKMSSRLHHALHTHKHIKHRRGCHEEQSFKRRFVLHRCVVLQLHRCCRCSVYTVVARLRLGQVWFYVVLPRSIRLVGPLMRLWVCSFFLGRQESWHTRTRTHAEAPSVAVTKGRAWCCIVAVTK